MLKLRLLFALLCLVAAAQSALIVNAPQAITQQVTVQMIQTQMGPPASGSPAGLFGTPSEQGEIESLIDQIWAQAGIDVLFLPTVNLYVDSFAYQGTVGNNNPRPTGDLSTIVTQGALAGVANANPLVINMYFVNIVPGFSVQGSNTVNGLAFIGANGIAAYVGSNLPTFLAGREVIASVIAHELGHNLGLNHIVDTENLMQSSGSPDQGERLNSAQILTALNSPLSTPIDVPEPATWALTAVALLMLRGLRINWVAPCAVRFSPSSQSLFRLLRKAS